MVSIQRKAMRAAVLASLAAFTAASGSAAELIYQEGFNTDGEPGGRYTFTGRDVYEVPRIQLPIDQGGLGNFDQKGPLYWGHNFDTSYAGIPNIPARRMLWTWRSDPAGGAASDDFLKLWENSVKWLLNNKAGATIVVHPNAAAINELATKLTELGYNVVDDDLAGVPDEQDVAGDLFIHGPGAGNASRFAMLAKPVIVINDPDYDDMLVGSIGSQVTFDPGIATITAAGHPAVGSLTGTFTAFNSTAQPFGIVGSFAAPGSTTLATVTRIVPPAINNLTDVDAVIAGTKQNENAGGTVADIDFSDATPANWTTDNSVPGGYAGNWGLRVQGKLTVKTAGTYRFALGSDDGAKLWIDRDKNGFTTADLILDDPGPHGHQIVYADVQFTAAGVYDVEVRSYNSGGGGSLEVSVSNQAVPVPDDALDSGYWEVLGTSGTGPVVLQSDANVTGYIAVGPNVEVQTPLAVVLNGPADNPPGSFYDGGPYTNFEGAGFIAASGLNKWAYPDGLGYRSVQLKPVSVAGKQNVKLTVALAASVVDFETSDFVQIVVYPNGTGSTPVILGDFAGVANAIQPWLADKKEGSVRRLTKNFADFIFDVPAGATDLVVEIRVATTWWTEIAAIDNIRITSGAIAAEPPILTVAKQGANVVVTTSATLQRTTSLKAPVTWENVATTGGSYTVAPAQQGAGAFFRAVRQ